MKVKEYLVNRLVEVERDLENSKRNYDLLLKELDKAGVYRDNIIDELDHYKMEREHIKQIITCNIGYDDYNHLTLNIDIGNNDFKTLLAILDIKPEDYKEVIPDGETED